MKGRLRMRGRRAGTPLWTLGAALAAFLVGTLIANLSFL